MKLLLYLHITLKCVVSLSVPTTLVAIHIKSPKSSRSNVAMVNVLSTMTSVLVVATVVVVDEWRVIGRPFNVL